VIVSDVFTLFYAKTSLIAARLLNVIISDALSFIDLKFYFYHFYY
jgi:hypothetical protein